MNSLDKKKRIDDLFKKYRELERCSEIMIPLTAIMITNNDTEYWFEQLEAILKEGCESFENKKIIKTRFLYCEIPIDVSAKMYDSLEKNGIKIPRFWRRRHK